MSTWERGQEHFPQDFVSEAEAVRYLAPRMLAPVPVRRLSPEEWAQARRRAQETVRRTLASFEATNTEDK